MELRLRPNNLSVPTVYFIFHYVSFRSVPRALDAHGTCGFSSILLSFIPLEFHRYLTNQLTMEWQSIGTMNVFISVFFNILIISSTLFLSLPFLSLCVLFACVLDASTRSVSILCQCTYDASLETLYYIEFVCNFVQFSSLLLTNKVSVYHKRKC